MKSTLLLLLAFSLVAQTNDSRDKKLACDASQEQGHRHSCMIAEQSLPVLGRLLTEAHNGSISIRGWSLNQTLIRSRIDAWAPTESEAALIVSQVKVETAGGVLKSTGPIASANRSWSVSWEVFAPYNTDLSLFTQNGRVDVSDLRGRVEMKSHNGNIHVLRVSGDVIGTTHNGEIHMEVGSPEVVHAKPDTYNGDIHLSLPTGLSAQVHAETNNGIIQSEFVTPDHRRRGKRQRAADFAIGTGGPAITMSTNNGSLQIQKL